jgi:tetratricopeptide (TPR) repeat protein
MRYRTSSLVFIAALIAAGLSLSVAASTQTPQIDRSRAERLYPLIAWAKDGGQAGSILGDVAATLGIGKGEEVPTLAMIYRDTTGLQYSFHVVKDQPNIMILIRSTPDISDSWKIVGTGAIERSVHVDEHDKVFQYKFQPRLFDETLSFFEARVREARREVPAKPDGAVDPAETPPISAAPWAQPSDASIGPANSVAELIQRGNQYNLNSDYAHAIADFNQAIRLDSNSAPAFYGRAAVYYNMGDYDRAIQDYDQVLRLDPRNGMAVTFRALTYEKKNQR